MSKFRSMFSSNLAGNPGRGVEVDEEYELQGEDEITLAIKSNNEESIRTAFERLTPENFNRRRDVGSGYTPLHEAVLLKNNNAVEKLLESGHVDVELLDGEFHKAQEYCDSQETVKLFIDYYGYEISNLDGKIASSNEKLERTERALRRGQLIFALFAGAGFCIQMFRQISRIAFGVTDRDTPYAGPVIGEFLSFVVALPGLVILSNYVAGRILSSCEKKGSSLEGRLKSCIEEREKLENKLHFFQERISDRNRVELISRELSSVSSQLQDCRKENRILKDGLCSLRGSCSAQMNSVSAQLAVPGRDSAFDSPNAQI